MKQREKGSEAPAGKEKLWGPFLKFYTRFPIPWLYFVGAILLGLAATEAALQAAGTYGGEARRRLACAFGALLGYPEADCLRLMEANTEREPDSEGGRAVPCR